MIRLTFCLLAGIAALGLAWTGLTTIGWADVRPALAQQQESTFFVTSTDDSGPGSLRQAILDANASAGSDLVTITAIGTVSLLNPLPTIIEPLSIQGPGAALFRIDGQDLHRVFDVGTTEVTMTGLTVQRGYLTGFSEDGAAIRSTGALTLSNVNVLSNTVQGDGAGVYVSNDLVANDVLFQNNHSTSGIGGALRSTGLAVISNTQFLSNTAQGDGGGAFMLGNITLSNVLFEGNRCTAGSCDGGGLFSFSNTTIQETQFVGNVAQDSGGGLSGPGFLAISNTLFLENQSASGGGLSGPDEVHLYATQFLSNTGSSRGGGMSVFGDANLVQVLFQNNESSIAGGGANVTGPLFVQSSRFVDNVSAWGGGLHHNFGNGRIVNSLFAGNEVTNAAGAAMALESTGMVEVIHTTIGAPDAAGATAIDVLTGTVGITNTIIAGHAIGIDNGGGFVSQDYNLFFDNGANTQGAIFGGAYSFTDDPLFLNPAADDYHLVTSSPAVNAGMDAGIATDFDGELRPLDGGFDIGFDEVPLASIPPTPTAGPTPGATATPAPSPTAILEDYRLYMPFTQK